MSIGRSSSGMPQTFLTQSFLRSEAIANSWTRRRIVGQCSPGSTTERSRLACGRNLRTEGSSPRRLTTDDQRTLGISCWLSTRTFGRRRPQRMGHGRFSNDFRMREQLTSIIRNTSISFPMTGDEGRVKCSFVPSARRLPPATFTNPRKWSVSGIPYRSRGAGGRRD